MLTIQLPPDLERALNENALAQGTTPELLIVENLRARFMPSQEPKGPIVGETMADFLGEFIGCIDSREFVPGGARRGDVRTWTVGQQD